MISRLRCITLFNITQTNVLNRSKPVDIDYDIWVQNRNTQCNFDTVVQIISLRSLPENITKPRQVDDVEYYLKIFGSKYQHFKDVKIYYFDFDVNNIVVFKDENNDNISLLYNDCHGVPMTNCKDQLSNSILKLDITSEFKNIHFEVLSHYEI